MFSRVAKQRLLALRRGNDETQYPERMQKTSTDREIVAAKDKFSHSQNGALDQSVQVQ